MTHDQVVAVLIARRRLLGEFIQSQCNACNKEWNFTYEALIRAMEKMGSTYELLPGSSITIPCPCSRGSVTVFKLPDDADATD